MDIYSFFSEIGELETRYGHWLLGAVGAGGDKTDITWDQYLEVWLEKCASRQASTETCKWVLQKRL